MSGGGSSSSDKKGKTISAMFDEADERRLWIQSVNRDEVAWHNKLVIVTVGLPARGKSYISHKLVNFLSWSGIESEIFNAGRTRRELIGSKATSSFFESKKENVDMREKIAFMTLDKGLEYLIRGGEVMIFDATNSTKDRRKAVLQRCGELSPQLNVLFVEVICNSEAVLHNNMTVKIKNSPDYKNWEFEVAMADLKKRIKNYEKRYETIQSDELSYIKLINLQAKVICNRIYGNVSQLILSYLMKIHVYVSPIYLCLTGSTLAPDHSTMLSFAKHLPLQSLKNSMSASGRSFSSTIKSSQTGKLKEKKGKAISDVSPISFPFQRSRSSDAENHSQNVFSSSQNNHIMEQITFSARPVVRTPKSLSSWLAGTNIQAEQKLNEEGKGFAKTLAAFLTRKSRSWCEQWNVDLLPRYDAATRPPSLSSPSASPRTRSNSEPGPIDISTSSNKTAKMGFSKLLKLPPPRLSDGAADTASAFFGKGVNAGTKDKKTGIFSRIFKEGISNTTLRNTSGNMLRPNTPSPTRNKKESRPRAGAEMILGCFMKSPREFGVRRHYSRPRSPDSLQMQMVVYTSGQPRAVATAREIPTNITIHPALNSLNTGACTGMTYDDMERLMPEEIALWKENPFTYRFPAGESQQDLVQKLQTLVMEFEGHVRPLAVISHVSTLQVLYAYFLGHKFRPENYHTLQIPKNTVIELIPSHYGWKERRYNLSKLSPDAQIFPGEVYDHNTNFYSNAKAQKEAKADD